MGEILTDNLQISSILQYRLKSYAHWESLIAREERVYCTWKKRDQTAVHEQNLRGTLVENCPRSDERNTDTIAFC